MNGQFSFSQFNPAILCYLLIPPFLFFFFLLLLPFVCFGFGSLFSLSTQRVLGSLFL